MFTMKMDKKGIREKITTEVIMTNPAKRYSFTSYLHNIDMYVKMYYNANMDLIDIKAAQTLFDPEWPIYTRTNDSCPTHYYETAQIRNSVVSNGCQVEGTIENSILGRGCIIHKNAVIKNSVVLSGAEIGEGVHVENQVVDKMVKILHVKEVVSDPALPGYIKRRDIL